MFDPRFMDKLTFNEANKNEEIEKRKKKKRLTEGSFDPRHGPQQSSHLEAHTPRKGPIQDSPLCQTQEVSFGDPLVSMKIHEAEPSIVA